MYEARKPGEDKPAVRWLPFQLNPNLPEGGVPRKEYLEQKFGSGHSYERIENIGREVGIDFAFDRIAVQPNTLHAHRLLLYGAKAGHEDETAEQLFRAYFQEGRNITDHAVLADIGERAGLDRAVVADYLASDDGRKDVLRGDRDARRAGITAVPCFIFNHRTAVSGAQPPETLLQLMIDR